MQRIGAIPTETDLLEIRSERDQSWQLLCRQWLNGEDVSTEINTFEGRLTEADELSDRLRREADRVHTLAGLQAKHIAVQQQAGQNKPAA